MTANVEEPALAGQTAAGREKKITVRASLLICNSCLWCASALGAAAAHAIDRCPACGAAAIEALPILPNEAFRMIKKAGCRGIELDFTLAA